MQERWAIGPHIGVARVGNAPKNFYLEPDGVGALPIACDLGGNPKMHGGEYRRVQNFKDAGGADAVLRQAAWFRLFRYDKASREWVPPENGEIEEITWTVHLANKKSAWYSFHEYDGNLLLGPQHSYAACRTKLRNPRFKHRAPLVIDPGSRSVSRPGERRQFDLDTPDQRAHYPLASFPKSASDQGLRTLGEMFMNRNQELVVLGGFGRTAGDDSPATAVRGEKWYDDIADGPVRCVIKVRGQVLTLTAWCIVGPPKVAPELVNIVTLADTMEDVAIRCRNMRPGVFRDGRFNPGYRPDYQREILPILQRPAAYRWVANVPVMGSASPPPFDARDRSAAAEPLRRDYLGLFRPPAQMDGTPISTDHGTLWRPAPHANFPLMPLNAGSNPVRTSPGAVDKFLTLTETQYFMLCQWALGKFVVRRPAAAAAARPDPLSLTLASMGNCVGGPFCPGIEVSWNTRNPKIYDAPLRIRHRRADYAATGLDPAYDETADGADGCEPGDLTKRMAVPWQADFKECSAQLITFGDPDTNDPTEDLQGKATGLPKAPTYFAHWWPPQSPISVIVGDVDVASQDAGGAWAGMPQPYARGINTFRDLLDGWQYLGFILNRSEGPRRDMFPNFVEQQRDHGRFDLVPLIPDPSKLPAARSKVIRKGKTDGQAQSEQPDFGPAWLLRRPTSPAPAPAPPARGRRAR